MKPTKRTQGFSLVEILVGLAIGIIGMIVMLQVFSVSEQGRRANGGGDDAINSGTLALYSMERDIRQAGYGITNVRLIGCNVTLPNGFVLNAMAPVTINHAAIPAGDQGTDTILVVSGNSNGTQLGDVITAQPVATAPRTYTVANVPTFNVNDLVIAQTPNSGPVSPCNVTMEAVTSITAGTNNVNVATGVAGVSNGILYNMGKSPRIIGYAIRNGVLTTCDFMVSACNVAGNVNNPNIWVPLAGNIVEMRAVYGRDATPAAMDAVIDTYDRTTPVTACGWSRVFTMRLALVARNNSYEKTEVSTTSTIPWMGSNVAPIDLSDDADWRHYRYKLFQTEVPIRNVLSTGIVPPINGVNPC